MPEEQYKNSPLIAVIDDEAAFTKSISIVLRSRGYRVDVAHSAPEAWAMIQRKTPHVILCDINMPGADGIDLYSQLRSEERFVRLPFVFLSGLFTPEEASERSESARPGTYYLAKPVHGDELTRFIEQLIAAHPPASPGA